MSGFPLLFPHVPDSFHIGEQRRTLKILTVPLFPLDSRRQWQSTLEHPDVSVKETPDGQGETTAVSDMEGFEAGLGMAQRKNTDLEDDEEGDLADERQ